MVLPFGLLRGKMSIMESESVMGLYVYDGADIVAEKDGSGNYIAFYVHGPGMDEPLARIAADGSVLFYHADGLGSVVALTDAAGAVTTRYRYSPFGKTVTIGEDVDQPFRFTGREWDAETGLYFYRARYYSPDMGRFITEDPMGLGAGDVNFYAYVGNNPVNYVDPLGLLAVMQPENISPEDFADGIMIIGPGIISSGGKTLSAGLARLLKNGIRDQSILHTRARLLELGFTQARAGNTRKG